MRVGEGWRTPSVRTAEAGLLDGVLLALVLPRYLALSDSDVVGAALPLVDEISNDVVSLVILMYQSRIQDTLLITSKQSIAIAVFTRKSGDLITSVGSERTRGTNTTI